MLSAKYEGLSYPTHFLNVRVVLSGINFLNTELNKPHFLRDERIFMHYSLQIKQNMYSIGIFRAPVVTEFIVEKSPILERLPFLF